MQAQQVIRWAPRVLGIGMALFVGMFALDAFSQGLPPGDASVHFAVHLLPSLALLGVVAASWRHEWIGGAAFITIALLYAGMVWDRLDWIAVVSTPLLLIGLLFMVSWMQRRRVPGPRAHRAP